MTTSTRTRVGNGGDTDTGLIGIMHRAPSNHATPRRKDLRPIIILSVAVYYVVTLCIAAMVVVSRDGALTARACIETGAEWRITDAGERECIRKDGYDDYRMDGSGR